MRYSQCPACGAKVHFRASSTLLMVCEYCQSTLLRNDADLENLGKMAELLPDSSLLQIGSSGHFQGDGFVLIGRIQFEHESGVWNSWHLLFDTGKTGWLSEASGSYALSFAVSAGAPDMPLERYVPELSVPIHGQRMTVIRVEQATCIAGQGELAGAVPAGKTLQFVEFAASHGNPTQSYASLEFDGDKPTLYLGQAVSLATLQLHNLRDAEHSGIAISSRQLQCPACGGSWQLQLAQTLTATCPHCASVLDTRNDKKIALLMKQTGKLQQISLLRVPLGSVGRFDGASYTVIGFLRRSTRVDGLPFQWEEYLLHHPGYGFRWLVCSQGHWNLLKPVLKAPTLSRAYAGDQTATLEGTTYRHFAKYKAKIDMVAGEFYWRVKIEDSATLEDYIAPPLILSKELQGKEINWSEGRYLTPEQVNAAFDHKCSLSEPRGIFANQPCPYEPAKDAWLNNTVFFVLLAMMLQCWFVWDAREEVVLGASMQVSAVDIHDWSSYQIPSPESGTLESDPFEIHSSHGNVLVDIDGSLDNSWLYSNITLVNLQSGLTYNSSREISDYSGYDQGEYWRENNSHADVVFSNVPPGRYQLQVETESEKTYSNSTKSQYFRVISNVPLWSNVWWLLAFLLIGPATFYFFKQRFEQQRWAESDHPMTS